MLATKEPKATWPLVALPKEALTMSAPVVETQGTVRPEHPPETMSRGAMLERIALLEAGREDRLRNRRRNRLHNQYFKIVSRTNDEFNRKFRGRNKGQTTSPSADMPASEFAEKRVAAKFGWSKRNGKREFRGE